MIDPPKRRPLNRPELYVTLALGAVLLIAAVYRPGEMRPLSHCGFKMMTRMPCPFCGMTRSFCDMARGHVGNAFYHHPFGPLLFTVTAVVVVLGAIDVAAGSARLRRLVRPLGRVPAWGWLLGIALIWAARILSFLLLGAPA